MKTRILVVDDDPDGLELVDVHLRSAGYEVLLAQTGHEALDLVRSRLPDLVVLDLMLPEIDGLEVCKLMRREPMTSATPILILSAKTAEIDRILGFEFGADDYVTKPFSPRELVLRIKSLLRRRGPETPADECYRAGRLVVDASRHQVSVEGREISLTPIEFKLLEMLIKRRGRVQSRDQLLQEVWGYDGSVPTRTVDTHILRLRGKLGPASQCIGTIRNLGYRFIER